MSYNFPVELQKTLEKRRGKQFTEKQLAFLDSVVANDFNIREAGKEANLNMAYTYSLARQLNEEIIELMKVRLVMDAGVAMDMIVRLMSSDEPISNANVRLEAAKQILDRIGLTKPEKVQVDHNVSGGLFLLPQKDKIQLKDIEGEIVDV